MEIKNVLEQIGLEGKKADIYLAALELGGASVVNIAKKAGIKRTTVYDILLDLQKEGYIAQTAQGKKRLFFGEDPEKIQENIKRKESLLLEILPQLQSINNTRTTKPKVRFYEGKNGLKEVYADTLKYTGVILIFASYDVVNVLGADWVSDYLKQRINKDISARAIIPGTTLMLKDFIKKDYEQRRMTKVIDPQRYPFSIEVNIYGHDKVALMSSKEETGIIIEGAEIHNTMKVIFELMWDLLPEIKIK